LPVRHSLSMSRETRDKGFMTNQITDPVVIRILNMMEQRGITQREMASMLGISEGSFSKWKTRGSKSYSKYLGKLSEILNVPVSYLLTGNLEGDRKATEHMYSENTRAMIRMFDEMDQKEQMFFLDTIKRFKTTFDE